MTRIFTDGAEIQDLLFWNTYAALSISTTQYRSGAASYYIAGWAKKNITDVSELYLRFAVRANSISGVILRFYKGSNVIARLDVDSSSKFLKGYTGDAGTLIGTGSTYISSNVWYLIEIHYKVDDSNGIFHLYADGIQQFSFTGDTKPGSDTTIDSMTFYSISGDYTYYDDLAMNDTSNVDGKNDNSWCGDGHIEILTPNAEGDVLQWNTSTGGTHYTLVDDNPPDSDTSYVASSGIGSKQDMYNLTSFTDTNKSISRIFVEARAKDFSTAASVLKLGIKTGGNVYLSSGTILPASYTLIKGEEYLINPIGSGIWTKADLDALQIVIESV